MSKTSLPLEQPFGNYAVQGLAEFPLPDPLPFLPFAPAWKYVFLLLALYSLYRLVTFTVYKMNNRYRKQALIQVGMLANQAPSQEGLSELAQLIKGTALYVFKRDEIASLTGKAWFDLLNKQAQLDIFDEHTSALLGANLYQVSQNQVTTNQWQMLIGQTQQWLEVHSYTGVQPLVKPLKKLLQQLIRGQYHA